MAKHNNTMYWWNGIVFRSLAAVTLLTALIGGLSSLMLREQVVARAHTDAQRRLEELLDTVENTASVAAFANDEQLAREVVQGLLRNTEVRRVSIHGATAPLADANSSPPQNTRHPPIQRRLMSPFKQGEYIGEIRLEAHWNAIYRQVEADAQHAMLLLSAQTWLMIFGTAGMVFWVVVLPIKVISDRLHQLNASGSDALTVPEGYDKTELGRLVDDINDLKGRLISTLDQERALRWQQGIAQRMYQDLFDHSTSGIFVADLQGQLLSFNPAFVELTWLPPLPNEPTDRRLVNAHWDEAGQLLQLIERSTQQHESCAADLLLHGPRSDERWLNIVVLPLGDGTVQGTITDVTARKREEISARRLAVTDPLTGFANREGLFQAHACLNAASDAPFAVVMIDLEGFRQINDALGFSVGDQVLLMAANRIREAAHPDSFLARVGGDEFVIILRSLGEHDTVETWINNLQTRLSKPYKTDTTPISMGSSAGIALFPHDGTDIQNLLHCAKLALGSAHDSRHGVQTNPYLFFHPELLKQAEYRRRLEDDLRLAVEQRELKLVFQPIVDLRTGQLAGAEALLRWQHAERGAISPEVFIPLAERIGLIGEIGRQVLNEACRQAAHWRQDGLDIYVSVNVSASQIPEELPPESILETLRRHGLPSQAIALEITEGVLMGNISVVQNWIAQLRAAGLRIYLDDFGTGYSSLSYLKRFPMDTVKVDKSFIMDMSDDHTLVDAIITMTGSLGLTVVAEGIEEIEQLDLLRAMGCGYGQGYLFSRPVAAADFIATARRINTDMARSAA